MCYICKRSEYLRMARITNPETYNQLKHLFIAAAEQRYPPLGPVCKRLVPDYGDNSQARKET